MKTIDDEWERFFNKVSLGIGENCIVCSKKGFKALQKISRGTKIIKTKFGEVTVIKHKLLND